MNVFSWRLARGITVALLVAGILASSFTVAEGESSLPTNENCNPPTDGSVWEIPSRLTVEKRYVTCVDQTITVAGLDVSKGNVVTFHGVRLEISDGFYRGTGDPEGVIQLRGTSLDQAAELYVHDSTITALTDSPEPPTVSFGGGTTFHFIDSSIDGFQGISLAMGRDYGEALMERSTFTNLVGGIVGWDNDFTLRDSFIYNTEQTAIYTEAPGKPLIEGNTISTCYQGIKIKGGEGNTPTVRGNTITNCQSPIQQEYGDAVQSIHQNDLFWNENTAYCEAQGGQVCPTPEYGFVGDCTNNWWGQVPPPEGVGDYCSPYLTSPVHPERLPSADFSIPSSIRPGESFTLTGTSSPSTQFGFPIQQYLWDFGDGSTATGKSVTHTYPDMGTYEVQLRVVDDHGLSRSKEVTVNVGNAAPNVGSVSFSPNPPVYGQDLRASASASDPDGDAVTKAYQWTKNGASTPYTGSTIPASALNGKDTWKVTVTATDEYGATASKSASVTVPNRAPAMESVSFSPAAPRTGDDLQVQATASDPDGHSVSYQYTWFKNGVQQGSTGSSIGDQLTAKGQTWKVRVTPTDGYDTGSPMEQSVTIANTPPAASTVTITPVSPQAGQGLHASATATDADGDSVTWSYQWTRNGAVQSDLTGPDVPGQRVAKGDSWAATATPHDGSNAGTSKSATVAVQNTPPSLESIKITPTQPFVSDDLQASATGSDPDGDTVTYAYEWKRNGVKQSDLTSASVPSPRLSSGDTWTVTATPTDGKDTGSPSSTSVTVENRAPSITNIQVTPQEPTKASSLKVTASASDPDGDTVSYSYQWLRDGQTTGLTGSTVEGNHISKGESWSVRVTATDGMAATTSTSNPVVVKNTAPVLQSVQITPTSPKQGDSLQAKPSASDQDGDTVSYSYEWREDGRVRSDLAGPMVPGSEVQKGEEWKVRVTPSDGEDAGAAVAVQTVIGNTAPRITSLHVSPENPDTQDSLEAVVESSDGDGDAVSYSYKWTRNGVVQGDLTGSTVPAAKVVKGDSWKVSVTASDGKSTAQAASDPVLVVNSVPVVQSASASPDKVTVEAGVTFAVQTTDPDEDPVTVTWVLPDGSTSTGSSVETMFTSTGTKTAHYTVTDQDSTLEGEVVVVVAEASPPSTVATSPVDDANDDGDADVASSTNPVDGVGSLDEGRSTPAPGVLVLVALVMAAVVARNNKRR